MRVAAMPGKCPLYITERTLCNHQNPRAPDVSRLSLFCGRIHCSRVGDYLPAAVFLFLPHRDVFTCLGDVLAFGVFSLELPLPQAISQVARGSDIDLYRLPRELIGRIEILLQVLPHLFFGECERLTADEVGSIVRKE